MHKELEPIETVLRKLKDGGEISMAYVFGSFAEGAIHRNSDIDLAVYIEAGDRKKAVLTEDRILAVTPSGRSVDILRLDLADASPFVVQKALKGIPLVDNSRRRYYEVAVRALKETEVLRHDSGQRGKMEAQS